MKRLPATILVAALAVPALIAAVPEARSAPCAGSVDEARRHMESGFALYDKKQFLEAAAEFDAAYHAQPFSAFLCNAAMAYQAALDFSNAIVRYQAFLRDEPNPPDAARIKQNLAWLEAQQAARRAAAAADADGGTDGGAPAIDASGGPPPVEMSRSFRSQIIVVSDPPEAPLHVYARQKDAPPFVAGAPNPGWTLVGAGLVGAAATKTPHDLSLGPGDYHIVIEAFRDYKRSETDLVLLPGHLYEFKANLSQGEFMGFLRVLSSAPRGRVYLDDPPPHKKPPWGLAPHGALVESGAHRIWVEAPGYEEASAEVTLEHGKTVEITPALERVRYGYLDVDGNAEEVTVRVDGAPRGVYTPTGEALRLRLPSGVHRLELDAGGRKSYAGDVEVPRGQELGVHGRLSFKPARSTAVVSGALAVGAFVGSVLLFRQAAQPQTPSPGSQPGSSTLAPTLYRVGGGLSIGVGALLSASTIYSIVSDPTPPSGVKLDKPKDLDESDLDSPLVPGRRGRVFGDEARASDPSCGAL